VLGMPPAFVLSQDQTLRFACQDPGKKDLGLLKGTELVTSKNQRDFSNARTQCPP
jgi:hypothetical protein